MTMVEYEMMELRRLADVYVRSEMPSFVLEREVRRVALRVGVLKPLRCWMGALAARLRLRPIAPLGTERTL